MTVILQNDYENLIIISICTGLIVEFLKKKTPLVKKQLSINVAAIIIAIALSIIESISNAVFYSMPFDAIFFWRAVDMAVLSSIMAMVGYDKLKQTITQLKNCKGDQSL